MIKPPKNGYTKHEREKHGEKTMIERFSRFVAYNSKIILIVAVILIIPSLFGMAATEINYDILSYLPDELDSVKGEEILDKVFGNAGSAFLIVENMPSKDVSELKEKILAVDGVKNAVWVDTFGDISVPSEILPDVVKNIFYSVDGNSTMMMIQFEGLGVSESTMNAVERIKSIMNKQCFISGMSVLMSDTKNIVEGEAFLYIAVSVILAIIVLCITMGSVILPLIIMISIGISIIYNMGTNFFGEVSYITRSIAAVLQMGVTMDYSVFLSDRYTQELKSTGDNKAAMANAISKTFFSVSGSALTTVFGFLAMCFMSFSLGLDIGIVMSKGVVFGVLSALLILPSMLQLFYIPSKKTRRIAFVPKLGRISSFSLCRKKPLVIIFAVLLTGSYILKSNVDVYYDFIKALPQNMTSVVSLSKLKEDFGMSSTYFVLFDDSTESYDALKMAEEFKNVEGVTSVLSLNSVVGPAVPDDIIPEAVSDICRKGGYELMMISSVYPTSTDESNFQTDALNSILKKYDENGLLTGEAALSKDLVTVTDRDFRATSLISAAAVFAVIAFLFKSFLIPAVLISSVELAIFINEALPVFTGEEVPFIAPTVIGCVQLGATVDYALLITSRFREELEKGKTKFRAAKNAAELSAESIFQSALVLFCVTFGVYCVCNVMLVKSICKMLARGAVISAAVVIIFLPALLVLIEPAINRKNKVVNNEN